VLYHHLCESPAALTQSCYKALHHTRLLLLLLLSNFLKIIFSATLALYEE